MFKLGGGGVKLCSSRRGGVGGREIKLCSSRRGGRGEGDKAVFKPRGERDKAVLKWGWGGHSTDTWGGGE